MSRVFQIARGEKAAESKPTPPEKETTKRSGSNVFAIARESALKEKDTEVKREPEAITDDVATEQTAEGPPQEQPGVMGKALQGAKEVGRHVARTAYDVASTAAGLPGDIMSVVNIPAGAITEAISGQPSLPYEKTYMGKVLPTSEQLRKGVPDMLKPETTGEELGSEFVQDLTSIFIPVGAGAKAAAGATKWGLQAAKRLGKSALIAGAGVGAREGAEALGAPKETAQYAKIGTLIMGIAVSANGLKGAEKLGSTLYKEMRNARPSDAKVAASGMLNEAKKLRANITKGGKAPSGTKALQQVDDLIEHVSKNKGYASVDELEAFARKTNELKSGLYEEFGTDKAGQKTAKMWLDSVSKTVSNGLEEYGKTNKPYDQLRKQANEVHGAIYSSKRTSEWIRRNATNLSKGGAAGVVGGAIVGAMAAPAAIVPVAAGLGLGAAAIKGGELIARLIKSPRLREYYLGVLEGATKESAPVVSKNLRAIERAVEEDPDSLLGE